MQCRNYLWSTFAMTLMAAGCEATAESQPQQVEVSTQALSRPRAPNVPSAIKVPEGNALSFSAEAEGVQVYVCAESANGAAWTFERPDALLFGRWGLVIGHLYEGPTWEALDDSFVAATESPDANEAPLRFEVDGAIPWLRYTATGFGGEGMFSKITYIHRIHTEAGLAPDSGCEPDHLGARVRVRYTATYHFYETARPSRA